jgi:flagellar hook-basal body complex protein FliE
MASPVSAAGAYAATNRLANPLGAAAGAAGAAGGVAAGGSSFTDTLTQVLDTAVQAGKVADKQASAAAQGKADMVDVVTAIAESESALETLVAVRDRVIAAYEEIMRMPV